MSVYNYKDYKRCVNEWISSQPNSGYGLYSRIAEALGTSSVVISQIFKGSRDLSPEQAVGLSRFMNHSTSEADYFLLLVQRDRAGTVELRQIFTRQLQMLKQASLSVKNRVELTQLSDQTKARFYSNWYYMAIWLAATIPAFSNLQSLSQHLQLPESIVSDVLRFLLDHGLLTKVDNHFEFGQNALHIPHDSPLVNMHHMNWRTKALQSMAKADSNDLHYTAPMALSLELREKIREELLQMIQRNTKRVTASPSETLTCISFDFFSF